MESQLTLWALIAGASGVVIFVMLILMLASVLSWVLIVQRGLYLRSAQVSATSFEETFWSGVDLHDLYDEGSHKIDEGESLQGLEAIFRAGFKEFERLRSRSGVDREEIMESSQRAMRIAIAREQGQLERHLPFLASVASVSPYIGLFGTVWGIMNSFRGLATVAQATLATVAPGISEALVATAMGLFAAIPAVVAYNRYASRVDSLVSIYETFAEEFSSILHRSLHAGRE